MDSFGTRALYARTLERCRVTFPQFVKGQVNALVVVELVQRQPAIPKQLATVCTEDLILPRCGLFLYPVTVAHVCRHLTIH